MESQDQDKENISSEFRDLAQNMTDLFQTAWQSQERKQAQQEIERSLTNLKDSINRVVDDFSPSATANKLKGEFDELKDRFESGEMESKISKEVINTLKLINIEITKLIENWSEKQDSQSD